MATFRAYNIQLTPLDTNTTNEFGIEGYKSLFILLAEKNTRSHKEKRLHLDAVKLTNEAMFSTFTIKVEEDHALGQFTKFNNAKEVTDLYTNATFYKQTENQTGVSNKFFFRFIYDFASHTLVVEENKGRLPSPNILQQTLYKMLEEIANNYFDKYFLSVNLISDSVKLEEAIENAKSYKKIELKITFPNGNNTNKFLKSMTRNNMHHLEMKASAERGSSMPAIPHFFKEPLNASLKFGKSQFTYLSKTKEGIQKFSSILAPKILKFRQKATESSESLLDRARYAFTGNRTNLANKKNKKPIKNVTKNDQ